jgi:hypothetical protein
VEISDVVFVVFKGLSPMSSGLFWKFDFHSEGCRPLDAVSDLSSEGMFSPDISIADELRVTMRLVWYVVENKHVEARIKL